MRDYSSLLTARRNARNAHFETHPVHEAELLVRQLLLLRHHVLGELEQRVFVAPKQLSDRHLHERLDLEDVHDGGHGQPEEPGRVLGLGGCALPNQKEDKLDSFRQ